MKKSIISKGLYFVFLSVFASAINFLSNIVFGKIFSVEDFGKVSSFQSFLSNIGVMAIPIQIIFCNHFSYDDKSKKENIQEEVFILSLINIIESILLLVFNKAISNYLGITSTTEYLWYILLIISNNLFVSFIGIEQGKQHFSKIGYLNISFYLIKLVVTLFLYAEGLGISAVIFGQLISDAICLLVLWRTARSALDNTISVKPFLSKEGLREYLYILLSYLGISFYMNNGDLLIANMYISKYEIGMYSVISSLSKISVFLIATPLATLILPKLTKYKNDIATAKRLLLTCLLIVFSLSLIYSTVLCLTGGKMIPIVYGDRYLESMKYAVSSSILSIAICILWIFYQFVLATEIKSLFYKINIVVTLIGFLIIIIFKPALVNLVILLSICILVIILLTIIYIRKKLLIQ